jgi:hypothetical protein
VKMTETTVLLFPKGGRECTAATIGIARKRALELGVTQVVVASSHGRTARAAHRALAADGIRVIAISISHGFEGKGWSMSDTTKAELREMGIEVHTGTHALGSSVGASYSARYGGPSQEEIIRDTLYRFGQGMKVAVECVLMAADAGLVQMRQEVIAIGGTGEGADTAIVCKPAYSRTFHDLEIREVLAKPRIP